MHCSTVQVGFFYIWPYYELYHDANTMVKNMENIWRDIYRTLTWPTPWLPLMAFFFLCPFLLSHSLLPSSVPAPTYSIIVLGKQRRWIVLHSQEGRGGNVRARNSLKTQGGKERAWQEGEGVDRWVWEQWSYDINDRKKASITSSLEQLPLKLMLQFGSVCTKFNVSMLKKELGQRKVW